MDLALATIIHFAGIHKYALLFAGAFLEGPIFMLAAGFFLHSGHLSFWPSYLTLVFGDFLADVIWYIVGRYAAHPFLTRFGHFFSVDTEIFEKFKVRFHRHDTKILIASKLTMGLGFSIAVLLAAGASKVNVYKYMLINLLSGFVWVGILMGIGYYFGELYVSVAGGFKYVFLFGTLVTVGIVVFGLLKFLRKKYG